MLVRKYYGDNRQVTPISQLGPGFYGVQQYKGKQTMTYGLGLESHQKHDIARTSKLPFFIKPIHQRRKLSLVRHIPPSDLFSFRICKIIYRKFIPCNRLKVI